MRKVTVKFGVDEFYEITEDGTIKRAIYGISYLGNYDIEIVEEINPQVISRALEKGFKVFECKDSRELPV
ncbi:MAG: hypothetical protein QXP85_00010 [Sulfolobaceae archaeon]